MSVFEQRASSKQQQQASVNPASDPLYFVRQDALLAMGAMAQFARNPDLFRGQSPAAAAASPPSALVIGTKVTRPGLDEAWDPALLAQCEERALALVRQLTEGE